ncbi:MAG: ureidoglycolate lyase [Rhizobiaceae bacterium]|nr:ureidoglycolate lyase [Rhizobiaceae bacterium]
MPSPPSQGVRKIETITESAFAPFGRILRHPGGRDRLYLDCAFGNARGSRKAMWINNPPQARFPVAIRRLEKHPFTPQAFLPMHESEYLAIACLSDERGDPIPSSLRAFRVTGPTSIVYSANVWHHGLLSFRADTNFVVLQSIAGRGDDVIHTFDSEIELHDD